MQKQKQNKQTNNNNKTLKKLGGVGPGKGVDKHSIITYRRMHMPPSKATNTGNVVKN